MPNTDVEHAAAYDEQGAPEPVPAIQPNSSSIGPGGWGWWWWGGACVHVGIMCV